TVLLSTLGPPSTPPLPTGGPFHRRLDFGDRRGFVLAVGMPRLGHRPDHRMLRMVLRDLLLRGLVRRLVCGLAGTLAPGPPIAGRGRVVRPSVSILVVRLATAGLLGLAATAGFVLRGLGALRRGDDRIVV